MLAAHHRPNNPTGKRLGLPHSHFEKTQLTDSTIYNVQPLKNRRFSSPVAKDGLGRTDLHGLRVRGADFLEALAYGRPFFGIQPGSIQPEAGHGLRADDWLS